MPGDHDNREVRRSFARRLQMRISFGIWLPRRQYPDLEMFDSVDEVWSAYMKAMRELRWEPHSFLYWTACVSAIVSVKAFFLVYGGIAYVDDEIALALVFAGFMLGHQFVFGAHIRRSLRRQLNEQGKPVCMGCGYDLTGNETGKCPECSWRLPESFLEQASLRREGLAPAEPAKPATDGRSRA